jgi:hypothetical protein
VGRQLGDTLAKGEQELTTTIGLGLFCLSWVYYLNSENNKLHDRYKYFLNINNVEKWVKIQTLSTMRDLSGTH